MSFQSIMGSFNSVRTRRLLLTVFLICATLLSALPTLVSATPAKAAELSKSCSIFNGFNLQPDSQQMVGYLTYLKIGDQTYAADLTITNPETGLSEQVVGVMGNIFWNGGYADPIQQSCQVSTNNKNLLATLVHTSLANTNVQMAFDIYEYDPETLEYYRSFYTNEIAVFGLINKSDGQLEIEMGTDQNMEVVQPANYTFNLGIIPQYWEQTLAVAVSSDSSFTLPWGVSIGISPRKSLVLNTTAGGSAAASPLPEADGNYTEGTVVNLTATADPGYVFTGWSGDASGSNPSVAITMNGDKTVSASFTEISQYLLFIDSETMENGSIQVTPDMPAGGYYDGTELTITAMPDTGYEFAGWGGALSGTTNPATLVMNETKTVSASFDQINHPPVANPDSATTSEDTTVIIPVLDNDSDPDGDPIAVLSVGVPTHGTTVNQRNNAVYTPDDNYTGTDAFSYTITDPNGGTASALVHVQINAVNDAPVASDDYAVTNEDTPLTYNVLANDFDADADPLSVSWATNGAHGSVTINPDDTVTYQPDANFYGTDSFSYTATDAEGGADTATVNVTVNPVNDAPVAVGKDAVIYLDATGQATITAADVDGGSYDPENSISSVTPDKTVFTGADLGANTVTLTITDTGGLSDNCQVTVTIVDDIPPVLTLPPDITAYTDHDIFAYIYDFGEVTAEDNSGYCTVIHLPEDIGPGFTPGVTEITWVAIDASQNSVSGVQTITVFDADAPVFVYVPDDITVNTDPGLNTAVLAWIPPTAYDNCDMSLEVQSTHHPGDTFPMGNTAVTYTTTDTAGNTGTASFTVTVVDVEPPVVQAPGEAEIVITPTTGAGAVVTYPMATATDNDGIASIDIISGPISGSTVPVSATPYTIIFVATDISGNQATDSVSFIVADVVAPTITAPADITVSTDPGAAYATIADTGTPVAEDNTGVVAIVNDAPVDGIYQLGTTTVTWTVTDSTGNAAADTQTITVADTEAPVLQGVPADITVSEADVPAPADVTAADNCPGVTLAFSETRDDFSGYYTLTRTWTATDAAGNSLSATQIVTVLTNQPPVAVATDITVEAGPGGLAEASIDAGSYDPDGDSLTITQSPAGPYPLGDTLVTLTVTDSQGVSDTAAATVTVVDTTPPALNQPADMTVEADSAGGAASVPLPVVAATDIADADITVNSDAPDFYPLGETIVTWTATDTSGNNASVSTTITVEDTTAPEVTIMSPADEAVFYPDTTIDIDYLVTDIADAAPFVTVTPADPVEGPLPVGNFVLKVTAIDASGNSAEASVTVTIAPFEAAIDFDPDTLNLAANGNWVTVWIELPQGYDAHDIDSSTILLNNAVPVYTGKQGWAKADANDGNVMDHDGDGIPERMVKFESAAVEAVLPIGEEVEITITGEAAGTVFSGSATIRVIDEGANKQQTNNSGGNSSSNSNNGKGKGKK